MSLSSSTRSRSVAERPFEHTARNGIRFFAAHSDFRGEVRVEIFENTDGIQIAQAVAEMIGYHALVIRPQLMHGSQSYDCIRFEFNITKD